ncbi:hypothetical protein VNO77_42508 [Canavalia gladiata]|uniref:Uncharacterized protein n=1 Tax=Canavalia gladiata TaxID=3824 RepID=A0AAN9PNL8_CANGL
MMNKGNSRLAVFESHCLHRKLGSGGLGGRFQVHLYVEATFLPLIAKQTTHLFLISYIGGVLISLITYPAPYHKLMAHTTSSFAPNQTKRTKLLGLLHHRPLSLSPHS